MYAVLNHIDRVESLHRRYAIARSKILDLRGFDHSGRRVKGVRPGTRVGDHIPRDEQMDDPGDPIADAVMMGDVRDWRKELQFFPTPAATAEWMVKLAKLPVAEPTFRLLEPSAGEGGILDHVFTYGGRIVAVEINRKMAAGLKTKFAAVDVHCRDFLTLNGELGQFDAVLMNPPFSKAQDIAHVQHAYGMLKSGGRLVAITSPGWTFRTDTKHAAFKAWFSKIGGTHYELPEGTFKDSGTNVRTVAIHITK